jgi:hypothetical protein
MVRLAAFVAGVLEVILDAIAHRKLPRFVTEGGNTLLEVLRADAKDLTNNIAYVLIVTIVFIAATVWWVQ